MPAEESESRAKNALFFVLKALDIANLIYIAVAAIIVLAGCGTIFFKHTFAQSRLENRLVFCDFAKYYVCAKLATGPDARLAYDQKTQGDYTVRYALGQKALTEEYIHYPPIDFPLMAPLARLPIEQAFLAFCLAGCAVFLAGTAVLGRTTVHFKSIITLIFFWLAVFGSVPMFRTFSLGQTSVFLTGIIAIYVYAMLREKPLAGGIALALTAIKPQYTLFLGIPALVGRRFRLIAFAVIAELLMILGAVATIGLQNVISYPQILLHSEQTAELAGNYVNEMVNARGLLDNFLGDAPAFAAAKIIFVVSWVLLAFLWFRFGKESNEAVERMLLAATVCFGLTFSPHTHLYDCCFLAVPAIVAGRASLVAAMEIKTIAAKLFAVLLVLYPVLGWGFIFLPGTGAVHTMPFAMYNIVLCLLAALAAPALSRAGHDDDDD